MNKACEQCVYNDLEEYNGCMVSPNCKLLQNKLKLEELEQAKPYLSSDYYWKRRKELIGEKTDL